MVATLRAGSEGELLNGFQQLLTQDSYEAFRRGVISFANGEETFESDFVCRTFEGGCKTFRLHWTALSNGAGKRYRIVCSLRDISRSSRIEEELKTFKTIADEANFGNVFCDPEGYILYVNKAFAEMHQYPVAELIGKHISLLYPPDELDGVKTFRHRIEKKGSLTDWKSRHRRKDGGIFPALLKVSLIKNDQGKPSFVAASAIDLTERKKIEDRLRQREQELQEKTINLEEMNAALKVLLRNRESDKTELEEKVVTNIKELAFPFLTKLKNSGLDVRQQAYVAMIEAGLKEVVGPFLHRLSSRYSGLTQTELTVATLVKEGKSTKEISEMMNLSRRSVDTYRMRLRKKLGIVNKKINLRTHLLSFQE